jgi:hypothetical protein
MKEMKEKRKEITPPPPPIISDGSCARTGRKFKVPLKNVRLNSNLGHRICCWPVHRCYITTMLIKLPRRPSISPHKLNFELTFEVDIGGNM